MTTGEQTHPTPDPRPTYRRVQPRGGSVYAGTITTVLTLLGPTVARKRVTWRDVANSVTGETERIVRDSYNLAPAALLRDGYVAVTA